MKKIEDLKWKPFDLCEIFPKIKRGKRLKNEDHLDGLMPYVSSSAMDNGVDDFVSNIDKVRIFDNCLTIANSGSVGASFYHPYSFVASDHVTSLKNNDFNKYIYLFIATISRRLSEKYSFNREINEKRISRERILLPIDDNNKPDYSFMAEYMKAKEIELLNKYRYFHSFDNNNQENQISKPVSWKAIPLTKIFNISATKSSIDRIKLTGESGEYPYLTRSDKDNGMDSFIGAQPEYERDEENVITIGLDTQTVFYQPYTFYTGQNIQILRLKNQRLNRYIALFFIPLIKMQLIKFNWGGNGATLGRLNNVSLMLPIDQNENPCYSYMETYMRKKEKKLVNRYINYKLVELGNENF